MPRTIESLQQIIHGLYSTSKCDGNVCPCIVLYGMICKSDNKPTFVDCVIKYLHAGMAKMKNLIGMLTGVSD